MAPSEDTASPGDPAAPDEPAPARNPAEAALVLPPVPLATGEVVEVAGTGRRVTAVELVVTTEDGGRLHIPLDLRHGAWWPPADPAPPGR